MESHFRGPDLFFVTLPPGHIAKSRPTVPGRLAAIALAFLVVSLCGPVSPLSAQTVASSTSNAPLISPTEGESLRSNLHVLRTGASGIRGSQWILLPDSTDSVTISRAGFSLSDFALFTDSVRWDPASILASDSTIALGGLSVIADSQAVRFADTLAFSVSGVSPFQKTTTVDSRTFFFLSNYPSINTAIFPGPAGNRTILSYTAPLDTVQTIGAPGLFEILGTDSTGKTVSVMPATHVTPVGSYLVSGPFEVIDDRAILDDGSDVQIRYLFAGMETRSMLRAFGSATDATRFFSSSLGLTPTDRTISIVSLPGIPDVDIMALAGLYGVPDESRFMTTEASRVARTASSVAFNYFGRYGFVTPADSWLFTGLPMYLGAMFLESDQGVVAFDSLMLSYEDAFFNSTNPESRPLFTPEWLDAFDLVDETALLRGAWTVHMIRHLVGEENFRLALTDLQTGLILQSDNLTQILETYLPDNLEPFQRELFYGDAVLDLKLEWNYSAISGTVDISLAHGSAEADWPPVPVTIEIETLTGVQRHYVLLDGDSVTTSVTVSGRPRYVTVDPDQVLLARVTVDQPVAAWVAQLRNAERLSVRVKAARALRQFSSDPALLIGLKSALRDERTIPVKIAIIETVASIPAGTAPRQTLLDGLTDASAEVRTASLNGLAQYYDDPSVHSRVVSLLGGESDERVLAAAVDYLSKSTYDGRRQVIESALITSTKNHLVRIAGIDGMQSNGTSREQLEVGRRYSSASNPAAVRIAALQLQAIALEGTRSTDLARTYLVDGDPALRMAAAELLATAGEDMSDVLRQALHNEDNPLVRKRLRSLLAAQDQGQSQLQN